MDFQAEIKWIEKELLESRDPYLVDAVKNMIRSMHKAKGGLSKEEHQNLSSAQKKELDYRMESYENKPDDVLDWENLKNDW